MRLAATRASSTGHGMRRSRALATALTASGVASSAIILTGSPVAGRFTFPEEVDHIRLPGVKKLEEPEAKHAAVLVVQPTPLQFVDDAIEARQVAQGSEEQILGEAVIGTVKPMALAQRSQDVVRELRADPVDVPQ